MNELDEIIFKIVQAAKADDVQEINTQKHWLKRYLQKLVAQEIRAMQEHFYVIEGELKRYLQDRYKDKSFVKEFFPELVKIDRKKEG